MAEQNNANNNANTNNKSEKKYQFIENVFTKIFANFNCPICLEEFKNTSTTVCGHRFCEECLKETITTHHKCPNCNRPLQDNAYIRDVVFDTLIDEMKVLKNEEMKKAVTCVIDQVKKETKEEFDLQSPLHIALKDYMANSLRIHEKYLDQIKWNLNSQLKIIDDKLEESIAAARNSRQNVDAQIQQLKEKAEQDKIKLKKDFDDKVKNLADKYSKYLNQTGITPLSLPVPVKLRIVPFKGGHRKTFNFNDLELKNLQDMQFVITDLVKKVGMSNDQIVDIPDDLLVLNLGPLSNYTNEEAMKICEEYIRNGKLPEFVDVLKSQQRINCFPIQEYFIKPDSEFLFYGNFKFESDLPKRCYRFTFDKANPKPVDYFKCANCDSSWICKSCKEMCHNNHNVSNFSLKHQPTWACCNCHKSGNCRLNE